MFRHENERELSQACQLAEVYYRHKDGVASDSQEVSKFARQLFELDMLAMWYLTQRWV
ncbi:hypothetical protein M2145_002567 [Lachnospiraceae bacterium PF1-21]